MNYFRNMWHAERKVRIEYKKYTKHIVNTQNDCDVFVQFAKNLKYFK